MINPNMREYEYFLYDTDNEYGQQTLIKDDNGEPAVQGTVKLSISNTSTSVQDNINYAQASYIGLTRDKAISDHYVIKYGETLLKVLYVTPTRWRQVFMAEL